MQRSWEGLEPHLAGLFYRPDLPAPKNASARIGHQQGDEAGYSIYPNQISSPALNSSGSKTRQMEVAFSGISLARLAGVNPNSDAMRIIVSA